MKKTILTLSTISLLFLQNAYGMKKTFTKNIFDKYVNFFNKSSFSNTVKNKNFSINSRWNNTKKSAILQNLFNKKLFNKTIKPEKMIKNTLVVEEAYPIQSINKQNLQKNFDFNISEGFKQKIDKIIQGWKKLPGVIEDNLFYKAVPLEREKRKLYKKTNSFARSVFQRFEHNALKPYSVRRSYSQKATEFDDYSLDGKYSTLDPKEFVQRLHARELKVADAVEEQVRKEEQKIYKEIKELEILNDDDFKFLQNLLKVRDTGLRGNYNEGNITFDETLPSHTHIVQMIKEAFQRADIPFKVNVIKSNEPIPSAGVRGIKYDMRFIFEYIDLESYLSKDIRQFELHLTDTFFRLDSIEQKYIIAHETIHILNIHAIITIFLACYLEKVKNANIRIEGGKFSDPMIAKLFKILSRMDEYQADVLPLAFFDYAQAAKHRFFEGAIVLSDIHVSGDIMNKLASRAVELHKVEQELLNTKNNS